ncbi:MAG: LysR family transcriptional regulator [Clostridium sp.]|nr:LysR family transcriptional regulator [Clostridium sp.]
MNLNHIKAFVKIADNKSFSRTAKELYLTQPTVSGSISYLENELGTQLFFRTTRGVELTEAGRRIYLYARQMLESADAIRSICSNGTYTAQSQQIVIAASSIPAQYLLPDILGELRRRHPDMQIRISETDSFGVANEIINHTADIGFCGSVLEHRMCEYIPFYSDELVIITPNDGRYQKKAAEKDIRWICREPMILREDGSGTRSEALKQLKKSGISLDDLNVAASISNSGTIIRSVKSGVGITIISRLAAQGEIERGEVLEFRLSEKGFVRPISMVYNSAVPLNEAARKLIHVVRELYLRKNKDVSAVRERGA